MKKIFLLIITILITCSCSERPFNVHTDDINVLRERNELFSFPIHSYGYKLVDLSDFVVLYAKNNDEPIYPASLTKLMTMDTVLNLTDDLDDTSYVTYQQVVDLIAEDASLAYIQRDYPYTLRDLLYALMLPSGADGALALENYFSARGIDLVAEMNKHAQELGCTNTHFRNTTGLHEDDHYTSLNDLFLMVMDTLKFAEGRQILESLSHRLDDGMVVTTGIRSLSHNANTIVLGGKTGYTPEAGQNIIVLYRYRGKSYVLLLCNAHGSYANDEYWHYDDCLTVFEELYQ